MIDIGGGRIKADESVDPAVGYSCMARLGKAVEVGEPLGTIHCRDSAQLECIAAKVLEAYVIRPDEAERLPLVHAVVA